MLPPWWQCTSSSDLCIKPLSGHQALLILHLLRSSLQCYLRFVFESIFTFWHSHSQQQQLSYFQKTHFHFPVLVCVQSGGVIKGRIDLILYKNWPAMRKIAQLNVSTNNVLIESISLCAHKSWVPGVRWIQTTSSAVFIFWAPDILVAISKRANVKQNISCTYKSSKVEV